MERKTENSRDRAVSMQSWLELRGLLANSSTIHAGLSTIRVSKMTFKVMLQGYKQTSSTSFCVLVYFRRKQTSLLAQKDSYPPRGQTSAELIDLHPASQPLQVLELKQSRCPPNNSPFPGEFRGLTMPVSSLLFVLGSTWASSVPALLHSNTLWHQKVLPPSLQDELSPRHLSTWLTENNSFCSSCRKSCFLVFFFLSPREAVSPNHWLKCHRPSWPRYRWITARDVIQTAHQHNPGRKNKQWSLLQKQSDSAHPEAAYSLLS